MQRRHFLRSSAAATASRLLRATEPAPAVVDLTAARNWVNLGGRLVELLTYNGRVPGPRIDLRPGQDVKIRLRNGLTEPTNLHFHGLHLAPSPGPDDAFLRIPPGDEHEYRFTLPLNHPGGTFWYHPHVHGYSAGQVAGGLAGAIVVRSDLETELGVADIPERVVFLQDFDLLPNGTLAAPSVSDVIQGREGPLVAASGETMPELAIRQDGLLRLRVINGSSSRFYNLSLEEHSFVVIGVDGGLVRSPFEAETIALTPGERVELLVRGNRNPGSYRFRSLPYARTRSGMGSLRLPASTSIELGRIVYTGGEGRSSPIPAQLGSVSPLTNPRLLRRFVLGQSMGGLGLGMVGTRPGMMAFTINGLGFDMDRIDTQVQLGETEDWEFLNSTAMDHPMHVHTNAFQIVGPGGTAAPAWKDTVLVKAGERTRVRTRFEDFTGLSVYHCHILDHEDQGMMGTLRIET